MKEKNKKQRGCQKLEVFGQPFKIVGRDFGIFDAISVVFAAVLYGYTVYITAKRRHFAAETDVDGVSQNLF